MKKCLSGEKKSKFAFLFGSALAIVITFASLSSGNANSNAFRLKTAQAAFDVSCDCALFGGNNKCAANNYGAQCAAAGTIDCSSRNSNCGGANEEL